MAAASGHDRRLGHRADPAIGQDRLRRPWSARTVAPSGIRWRNDGESGHAHGRPATQARHTPARDEPRQRDRLPDASASGRPARPPRRRRRPRGPSRSGSGAASRRRGRGGRSGRRPTRGSGRGPPRHVARPASSVLDRWSAGRGSAAPPPGWSSRLAEPPPLGRARRQVRDVGRPPHRAVDGRHEVRRRGRCRRPPSEPPRPPPRARWRGSPRAGRRPADRAPRSRGAQRSRRRPGSGRPAGTSGRVIARASAAIAPSPSPGKMKTLFAWPTSCRLPFDVDRLERRAGGDDGPAVGPAQDVDGRRLGGRGRVGERHDERPFGPRGQRAEDRLDRTCRRPRSCRRGRSAGPVRSSRRAPGTRSRSRIPRRPRPAAPARASWRRGPRAGRGPARANRPARAPGGWRPRPSRRRASQAGSSRAIPMPAAPAPTSTTRVSRSPIPRPAQPRQDPGHDDRRRPLDVVVERRHAIAVAIEDAQRVGLLEVLPLDDAARPDLGDALDERLDQRVVLGPAQARRAKAEVERVGEQRRVVGPDVERDRQRERRMDAAGRRVQGELADGDAPSRPRPGRRGRGSARCR